MDRLQTKSPPIERLEGRRNSDRREAVVRADIVPAVAGEGPSLLDISAHGCRVAGYAGSQSIGAPVKIVLGGLARITTWLRWAENGEAGLEFARPLSDEFVDRLSAAGGVRVEFS
ncbi:hypothetical protein [Novosphingobium sp. MMS21-SN21R]|uniref:hypothetical protein n=1 Tax=Novosphingobium sp. MMS21-SN21R TaxID=2969298 RepID=UPI002886E950|nr:hypothetical protein [Novosphingobium sp. MMS21-SN21R]MDT0507471.1 hypothetical protein [Novosphingobium sp. MMS21-SN21R]